MWTKTKAKRTFWLSALCLVDNSLLLVDEVPSGETFNTPLLVPVVRLGTNDAKIIWKIIWSQKRKAELKSNWAPLVRWQKQAWEIPMPLYYFSVLFYCRSIYFIWKITWSWDNTAKRNTKRRRAHWAVLGLGCVWLFVLHTRLNRAFLSVFRFVPDIYFR